MKIFSVIHVSQCGFWFGICSIILSVRDVAGVVTVTISAVTGIPNQQALMLRCRYTTDEVITRFTWSRRTGSGVADYTNVLTGSVTPPGATFLDTWLNKGTFRGDYSSNLDIELPANYVTPNYAGTYRCEVSGLSTNGQSDVTASVFYAPTISGIPSPYRVIESSHLQINCSSYTTVGNPPATNYTWTYKGSTVRSVAVLDRNRISQNQAGQYTCTATNSQGSVSTTVNVDVQYSPSISGLPSDQTVIESSRLQIDCSSYTTVGNPSTTSYTWTYKGSTVSSMAVLDRNRINRNQAGQYTCTATNTLTLTGGSQQQGSDTAQVNVDVQYLEAPVLTLVKTEVMENSTLDISCDVVSNPTAQMTITNTDNNTVLVKETTNSKQITINPVQCLHSGTYVCSANNPDIHTETSRSRQLNVLCSPRPDFRVKLNSIITKSLREMANLEVEFIANPTPNFTWYRYSAADGTLSLVESYILHKVTSTGFKTRLQINITDSRAYGDYAVVAQNALGKSETKYTLRATAPEPPPVSRISAGAIAGIIVGVLVVIIVAVMIILYRKGCLWKCGLVKVDNKKNGQEMEEDANRVYSTIDTIETQAGNTYEGLQNRASQQYSGLAVYEDTNGETTANQAVNEGLQDKIPTNFETVELNEYENTGIKVSEPTDIIASQDE